MSLSVVNTNLSSLKSCQTDVGTAMDVVTDAAMDLAETEGSERDVQALEKLLLDCARLDEDLTRFSEAVEHVTAQARRQPPEAMRDLKDAVKQRFAELTDTLSNADLQRHAKVAAFRESLRRFGTQTNPSASQGTEEDLDDDIAVMQSQINFSCPITQLEMVNPVKNIKCNHQYEQEAAVAAIQRREKQKKKFRCPYVGCDNTDVKQSDLVPDVTLRRMIQKKQGART
ncbi:E3 SUMO-protein ligase NSE2 [Brienomyrus brachyistius]|uniref:E3 SUMO-protein ligase NSE2 n=1 Tax=Brienomyrus brachyistius TaxID=42636 RepID=UPI0020B20DFA|nr:E3 SUMO-protein ligase NSE2 [Brienomyrus brachyistius]XP_048881065.1 E3 SUMO-protein ligase NSE2 [Brienomyrus brachyistius]XP_048881066.1 E3 SUMO-protein ligase NSE2 [Brienomyrus brachyistius]XP_048881068.1 E3 SUMO-protein ligase NSE2 [Brienomyrus brachyistius]XP_048881069.1 E3 SUMO-protein ligase NSE2 [Brienomyrus brachyistius]